MDLTEFERKFTTTEKLRAFLYHVYMCTVGTVFEPEKHEEYIKVFEEYNKWRKSRDKK